MMPATEEGEGGMQNGLLPNKRSTINASPRFEKQTVVSKSARADETNDSLDLHFYPTVQNHFLLMNLD